MMDILNQMFGYLFAGVFVIGLMSFVYKRDAIDWEQLVSVYGRDWQPPRLRKRFANMILYSEGRPAKSYKGIIEIGVLEAGIALRPNRILVPFQKPVYIPYSDIQGWKQGWYVDAKSAELSFRKAPQMRMIMPHDQVLWMLSLTDGAVNISAERPPHGTRPWATYIIAWVSLVLTLLLVAALIPKALPALRADLAGDPAPSVQPGKPPAQ